MRILKVMCFSSLPRLSLLMVGLLLLVFRLTACNGGNDKCTKLSDCKEGYVCCKEEGATEGECKESCPKTECPPNSSPCLKDGDCFNNQVCGPDNCCKVEPVVSCSKDDDCPKGKECIGATSTEKGKCESCARTCQANTDCSGKGVQCQNGCCRIPPCLKDDDCKEQENKFCDTDTGKCIPCKKDEHCKEKEVCEGKSCKKVECTENRHCTTPQKPICNTTTHKCDEQTICRTHDDCKRLGDPQKTRCDPSANNGKGECKKGHCVPCATDDECGSGGDFCVGPSQGLKDGRRCLKECESDSECPTGFVCSKAIITDYKICFPRISYCEDPCKGKTCPDGHECVEGKCVKIPEPCDPCKEDKDCGAGNSCITLINGKRYCGKSCKSTSDCPTDIKYKCFLHQGSKQCIPESGECPEP